MLVERLEKRVNADFEYRLSLNLNLDNAIITFTLKEKSTGRSLNLSQLVTANKKQIQIFIPNQIKFPSNAFRYNLFITDRNGKITQLMTGDFSIIE